MLTSNSDFVLAIPLLGLLLFAAMLGALEGGRRLALRRSKRLGGKEEPEFGALNGAVFGLLGLLIAFTFSGAASRFDARRDLVVQEANALGTAYLRLDLVEPGRAPR